jgi:hypothetical protein
MKDEVDIFSIYIRLLNFIAPSPVFCITAYLKDVQYGRFEVLMAEVLTVVNI